MPIRQLQIKAVLENFSSRNRSGCQRAMGTRQYSLPVLYGSGPLRKILEHPLQLVFVRAGAAVLQDNWKNVDGGQDGGVFG